MDIVARLERFPATLRAMVSMVAPADLRWKPVATDWSILEVCCHLRDEEREDFRPRLELVLEDPTKPWPTLHLEGIAERRRYNEQEPSEVLVNFERLRQSNVVWLKSLASIGAGPLWSRPYEHPKFGPIPGGMVLASWPAHDALHMRQISKRIYQLAERDGKPFAISYAGQW